MNNQELLTALAFVGVSIVGFFIGAYIRGQGIKEALAELKSNKEQLNDYTQKLSDAVPTHALDAINQAAQNAQDIARFMVQAQFPGIPFSATLRQAAGIALDAADIIEDVTDKTAEPVPFASKGLPAA